jgi:hypothetical protein
MMIIVTTVGSNSQVESCKTAIDYRCYIAHREEEGKLAKPEEVFLTGGPIILEEPPSDKETAKTNKCHQLHKLSKVYLSLNEYRRRKRDGQVRETV